MAVGTLGPAEKPYDDRAEEEPTVHLDNARELKEQLTRSTAMPLGVEELQRRSGRASGGRTGPVPGGLALGVRRFGAGRYGVAVRHDGSVGAAVAARAVELAGDEADVRDVGTVRALTPHSWAPGDLQLRERPLRPGLSVAQEQVSAGTIGAFVTLAGDARRYLLSNNHVLADSDRAAHGSAVLSPGPADRGDAGDRIGSLARAVRLQPAGPNLVDAALALLDDDVEIDPTYPVGALTGTADADEDPEVEKVGRTTGLTRGTVTAIELDGVAVAFPDGTVVFDGQVEVTGSSGAFSAGGDSGSLVYQPAGRRAVGLLFAGSERGGPGGAGLTFCNPVEAVLDALGVTLLG